MKRLSLSLLLLALAVLLLAGQTSIPRVYVQKLVLDNGKDPAITAIKDTSAPEYLFEAWIVARPDEVMTSETHSIHHLAITRVGNGETVPYFVVCRLNLGNFPSDWAPGDTLHMKITHRESKEAVEWEYIIPEGTNLIKLLDEPKIVPPYTKKQD